MTERFFIRVVKKVFLNCLENCFDLTCCSLLVVQIILAPVLNVFTNFKYTMKHKPQYVVVE